MRIAGVEAFPVALPFREPYIAANGTIEQREMVVLRITSEDGTAGHGDAVPMSLRGGPGLERILDELEGECAGALAGRELDDASDVRRLVGECGGAGLSSSASAAVDVALIDLLGRATGIPAARFVTKPSTARSTSGATASASCSTSSPGPSPSACPTSIRASRSALARIPASADAASRAADRRRRTATVVTGAAAPVVTPPPPRRAAPPDDG